MWSRPAVLALALVACAVEPRDIAIGVATPAWGFDVIPLLDLPAAPSVTVTPWTDLDESSVPGGGQRGSAPVRTARQFAALPELVAVVGHEGSRESRAAARVYNDRGIVQIVPTGTSRLLAAAGPWTFPLAPNDSLEGLFIAAQLERLGARRVATFFTNDEYGTGLRDGVAAALADRNIAVVEAVPVFGSSTNIDVIVDAAWRRNRFDGVVVAGRPLEAMNVADAVQRLSPGTPVIAGDGAFVLGDIERSGRSGLSGLRIVGFWHPDRPDSASRRFVRRFQERYDRMPEAANAMTYDALNLLLAAVRDVGGDPRAIRRYLVSLGESRPPYRGVTGEITFGPRREGRFVMVRYVDGAFRLVTETESSG